MADQPLLFYKTRQAVTEAFVSDTDSASHNSERLQPATCTEAEPFALRVLDDSMQPEFRKGCIIVIDPTGRATDGSFVLAEDTSGNYLFRQLCRSGSGYSLTALNNNYPMLPTADDLSRIVGVIVQRAGVRRSYHKRYD